MQGSFHEMRDGVVQGWKASGQHALVLVEMRQKHIAQIGRVACGPARSGPGRDETGVHQENNERAVGKPLVWDLAFQKSSTVRLNVCLETLFRAPTLGLSSMAVKEGQEGGEAYEK